MMKHLFTLIQISRQSMECRQAGPVQGNDPKHRKSIWQA